MQFNVPQFLEVEDKIIGPLTLKQFGYLAAGGAVLFLVYQYFTFGTFIIIAIPITLFCLALAFIKIHGRPFISILGAFISYILKPKLFVWKKKNRWKVADFYAEITLISATNRRRDNMRTKNRVDDFLYERESYLIRGACFEVWKEFKGVFKESIIDKALTIALIEKGLKVESQKRIGIYFRNKKVGTYVPDKIVNNVILIELKSKLFLTEEDIEQFWKYLKGSEYKLGFLINFSPTKLQIKRTVYDTARQISTQSALWSASIQRNK